jgi:hypothetical protein
MTLSPRVIGVALMGLLFGFLPGIFLGLRGAREDAGPRGKDPNRERLLRTAHVPASGETLTLQDISLLQQGEIARLEAEKARLRAASGKGMSREQKLAFAKMACETMAAEYEEDMHPDRKQALMRMLYEIDEDMTPYFIERYRSDPDPTIHWVSWYLAMAAGGPAGAEFLEQWIRDPGTPRELRGRLLESVCGFDSLNPISLKKIPVGDALGAAAIRLSDSTLAGDRMGAAVLLGASEAPEAEVLLRRMADSDADLKSRGVAIRSLGRIGTAETLAYLRTYPVPPSNVGYPDPAWHIKAALEESMKKLRDKFPE